MRAGDVKMEPTDSFYPSCRNATGSRHTLQQQLQQSQLQQRQLWQQHFVNNEQSLENLTLPNSLDAEFGLSFYDPYVCEPSLDLSPYLEDIDLADTTQQNEIFDLVSSVVAKHEPKPLLQQQHGYPVSMPDGDFERFLEENRSFMAGYNNGNDTYSSQTVPAFSTKADVEWRASSSDSSSPSTSPELPSDTRKLKIRRQRGRKSSCNGVSKSNLAALDKSTYEYRMKRERNNVAVRKSRMKTKEKQVAIFRKATELSEENEDLQSVVASLTKELQRLKSYLAKSGLSPMGLPIEA